MRGTSRVPMQSVESKLLDGENCLIIRSSVSRILILILLLTKCSKIALYHKKLHLLVYFLNYLLGQLEEMIRLSVLVYHEF
jgi:hypothetical protein